MRNDKVKITPLLIYMAMYVLAAIPLSGYSDNLFPITSYPMYSRADRNFCGFLASDEGGERVVFGTMWRAELFAARVSPLNFSGSQSLDCREAKRRFGVGGKIYISRVCPAAVRDYSEPLTETPFGELDCRK